MPNSPWIMTVSDPGFPSYQFEQDRLSLVGKGTKALPLDQIVKNYSSPFYIYNLDDIEQRVNRLKAAFNNKIHAHYAMKANNHPFLLKKMAEWGLGADIVSGGELKECMDNGIPGTKIVFSGVGKTKSEIAFALKSDIEQINIESPAELKRVAAIASELGVVAPVAFRLNPDVDPETHPYIKTGFRENKFGMDESFFSELKSILKENPSSLKLKGLTMHIGSQLRELSSTFEAVEKTLFIWDQFQEEGFELETLDIGGGVGIDYQSFDPTSEFEMLETYGKGILERVGSRKLELMCEPGRILVGRSGVLVCEVQYIKNTPHKNFAIVDTGMHHLLRPSLYQAHHRIYPLNSSGRERKFLYDVVGPICESSDVVGHDRPFQELKEGDLLGVLDAGAYGAVMASDYNSHPSPGSVFVSEGEIVHEDHQSGH